MLKPTGTSAKFASMMTTAVQAFVGEHGHPAHKEEIEVTSISLEGEGTIDTRVNK
jgi:hypothetical protein